VPYDAHIHFDRYEPHEQESMLKRAAAMGLKGLVTVSMDRSSCEANLRLARQYPGLVLPAFGHHPEQPPLSDEELEALCGWIEALPSDLNFAIGEVGLPYFNRTAAEAEGRAFDSEPYLRQCERFIRLAARLGRPINLHAVHEDADTVMDMLERCGVEKAHFHWFKGSKKTRERLIRNRCSISLTPEVLYDEETRELAREFPLELLLVETDGPWPFEGPYTGRRTEPGMVMDSIREIARLKGLPERQVSDAIAENIRRFYGFEMPAGG
jgi:TatD DNase family protein